MRVPLVLVLAAGVVFGQSGSVQNAAGSPGNVGYLLGVPSTLSGFLGALPVPGTAQLAPRSLAIIYYTNSGVTDSSGHSGAVVSVRPVGTQAAIPAQVIAGDASSITFVVPAEAPPGQAQLIYHAQGDVTKWIPVTIVPASFALFPSGTSTGALAQIIQPDGGVVLNDLTHPAQAGRTVVLWGSGLGKTPASKVRITLGGVEQSVAYAGAAPGQPGLDQINFPIKAGTPGGCYEPLTIDYGSAVPVQSWLSTAGTGDTVCPHPFHLPESDLAKLDRGGAIDVGTIRITSSVQAAASTHASRQELANFGIVQLGAASIASLASMPVPINGCASLGLNNLFIPLAALQTSAPIILSNGSSVLPVSPNGAGGGIVGPVDLPLSDLPAPFFQGGRWRWSSAGGDAVPSGSAEFTMPDSVALFTSAPAILPRNQDPVLKWNGASYDAGAVMSVAITGGPSYFSLFCTAPANAGSLTIPAGLLAQAPPTLTISTEVRESGSAQPVTALNETNGNTLLMMVDASTTFTRSVDIQ